MRTSNLKGPKSQRLKDTTFYMFDATLFDIECNKTDMLHVLHVCNLKGDNSHW